MSGLVLSFLHIFFSNPPSVFLFHFIVISVNCSSNSPVCGLFVFFFHFYPDRHSMSSLLILWNFKNACFIPVTSLSEDISEFVSRTSSSPSVMFMFFLLCIYLYSH